MTSTSVLSLIQRLCKLLETEDVIYCHWKSNAMLDRSATGDNDLDLLVDRSSIQRFNEILAQCGFKKVEAPPNKRIPGIQNYYGYDAEQDKFVHVHAHYVLIVGHDATKNYHLPIEKPYLASSWQDELFKVPSPEFELVVFVIRMALKHSSWYAMLRQQTGLSTHERQELTFLRAQADPSHIHSLLAEHLPQLDTNLFDDYLLALAPEASGWARLKTGKRLQRSLASCARRPLIADRWLKFLRYFTGGVQRRLLKRPQKQPPNGGVIVAVVGGDGAGKTTAVDAVYNWLSHYFQARMVHLGKPEWSLTTLIVRGFLKIGTILRLYPFSLQEEPDFNSPDFPGYPTLIRTVCTARDRRLAYARARRYASNGGIVFTDRFPLPEIIAMDGPQIERFTEKVKSNGVIKLLMRIEEKQYQQILQPDLLMVLRVDPDIAVARKTDESESSVRARTTQVWEMDWDKTRAHVIDASQPKSKVLSDLKTLIWSNL